MSFLSFIAVGPIWRHATTEDYHDRAFSSEVDTASHSNQVYADCVDLSAVENASKQETRASVLIESGPKLWASQFQYERTLRHKLPRNFRTLSAFRE